MTFRLLTYNILQGGAGRVEQIAKVINSCAPDLVLLQEATSPATVEQLAQLTGMAEAKSFQRQSLAFMSRKKVAFSQWIRPRISRHAFLEVVPEGDHVRVFGVHLAAVLAAWTERRRDLELRALLKSIDQHRNRFHVLTGYLNTVAPGAAVKVGHLPIRLRPLMVISRGTVRWPHIHAVVDVG